LPIHSYDFAKEFQGLLNEKLIELKLPGIIDVYEWEGECKLYYRYSGKSFQLKLTSSDNSMQGSIKYYKSDDILDQIEEIIDNSHGLMRLA
jgi:hypothetical protein